MGRKIRLPLMVVVFYILGCRAVTCAIPATSTANHVIDNMAAAIGRLTDAAMLRTMADYLQNL